MCDCCDSLEANVQLQNSFSKFTCIPVPLAMIVRGSLLPLRNGTSTVKRSSWDESHIFYLIFHDKIRGDV